MIPDTRFRLHARGLAAGGLALLALLIAGCGVATPEATPTTVPSATVDVSSTPSGPTATATPDLQALLKDGGIAIIQAAYDRLLDEYIDPLEPSRLLDGAWVVLTQEATALGAAAPLLGRGAPAFGDDRAAAFAAFRDAYVPLANSLADPTTLRFGAIRGMTQALQDCHTFFLNPVASDTLVDARSGAGVVGIGIELAGIPPLVTEVITGSPAEQAGILVGDRVTAVDGADTSAFGPAGAFELINGDEGTSVMLELTRRGDGTRFDVTAQRARVRPPNIDTRIIDGAVGYVRIRNFVDTGVSAPLKEALLAFDAQGVTSWIIDVRGNPGGRLDSEAISLFVREGAVVRDRGRGGLLEEVRADGKVLPVVRPTVLLANNRTGSVAEVFAAALQEYGVAYVIGANTNGCVGFTDIREFGDGSSMAVTTHVNLAPVSGGELNGIGVAPDLRVSRTESDIANALDPQLDAAVAHLLR